MKPTGWAEAQASTGQAARRAVRTARKQGEAGKSLLMRRSWYSDPPEDPKDESSEKPKGDAVDPLDAWVRTLPVEAQAGALAVVSELRTTRAEAKDRRLKLEDADRLKTGADEQRRKEEETRLAQQGEWEKLATERAAQIETLKPYQAEAAKLLEALTGMLDKRLESVPDHLRPLVKAMLPIEALSWLDANADKLNPPSAPDGDGGKRGDGKKPPLNADEAVKGRPIRRY